jgi:DNA-directed RNA polymerase specialized sigma24 family protein
VPDGDPKAAPIAVSSSPGVFFTTRWSVVLSAGQKDSPQAAAALETLCRAYWYPLYAYVRRRGYSPEDAQDLTQGYFARLLERDFVQQAERKRGKFRTFLLTTLSHYLADDWDRAHRLKRGGHEEILFFDAMTAEERYHLEPADLADPAKLFERRWATTVLEQTLARLESEYAERGQGAAYAELQTFLLVEQGEDTFAQAATRIGMTTAAMKMAVSRMRARCRQLLRKEILQTTVNPSEADEEYQSLRAFLRK